MSLPLTRFLIGATVLVALGVAVLFLAPSEAPLLSPLVSAPPGG